MERPVFSVLIIITVLTSNIFEIKAQDCTPGELWCSPDNCKIFECHSPSDVYIYKRVCPPLEPCFAQDIVMEGCCAFCRHQTVTNPVLNSMADSPCKRTCIPGESMTCLYSMTIEVFQAMSDACYDCPFTPSDCSRANCIPAEGIERLLVVANRTMPGPAIEVCVGDVIVVDIVNSLISQDTIIHWHGIPQLNTQYSDGAPFITQCPTTENNIFRYVFNAVYPGTYLWHSDEGLQNQDGLLGSLIIRQPVQSDPHAELYDTDDTILFLQHWNAHYSESQFYGHYMTGFGVVPRNILINGRGRLAREIDATFLFNATINLDESIDMVLTTIRVTQGSRTRIRIINGATGLCPFALSIDSHTMLVISLDGFDIEPVPVGQLILNNEERYDVIVVADQEVANYWIRVKGLLMCEDDQVQQFAILNYEGASQDSQPQQSQDYDFVPAGPTLDTIHSRSDDSGDTLYLTDLCSTQPLEPGLDTDSPHHKFYIKLAHTLAPNPMIMASKCTENVPTLRFNNITFEFPHSSLMTQPKDYFEPPCNAETIKADGVDCSESLCKCLHIIEVDLNSIVEVVLYNEVTTQEVLAVHLHGYHFRVVAMEDQRGIDEDKIVEMDQNGEIIRNFECPVLKDTVTLNTPGYTVIRFNASNPGHWLLSSTNQFRFIEGSALLFKVGDKHDVPPFPIGTPTCRDYPNYMK